MKLYYIGKSLEDWSEKGTKWSLEGIYTSLDLAKMNVDNDEFIVELEADRKLPKELHEPNKYWWKINNEVTEYG